MSDAPTYEERRINLLNQHQALRALIGQVRHRAEDVLKGGELGPLQASLSSLHNALEMHLVSEEALLEPILERIDAWGPLRLELLRAEHTHQRSVMTALRSALASRASEVVARRSLSLAEDLLADMVAEERELLDPRVLKDDSISVEFGG